jgi:hypothetical protein
MSPATEKVACRSSSVASTARPPTNTSVAAWRAQGAQRTRQPGFAHGGCVSCSPGPAGAQREHAPARPTSRVVPPAARARRVSASFHQMQPPQRVRVPWPCAQQRAQRHRRHHRPRRPRRCLHPRRQSQRKRCRCRRPRQRPRQPQAPPPPPPPPPRRRSPPCPTCRADGVRLSGESLRRVATSRGGAHLTAFPPPKRLTRARAARCRQQRPARVCAGGARAMLLLRPAPAVRCRGRAPLVARAAAASDAAPTDALAARVLSALNASAGSSGASRSRIALLDDALLAPDVVFSDDFGTTLSGREAYAGAAARWAAAHGAELGPALCWRPLRCASTGPEQLLLQWEATWIPEQMAPLVRFGRSVGWEVRRSLCLRRALHLH